MTQKIGDGWLSIKQNLFCKYCVEAGGNKTEAYCKAYWKTNRDYVRRYASRLYKNPLIKERIDELMSEAWLNRISLYMGTLDLANQNENMFVKLSAMNSLMKIVDKLDIQDKTTELINDTTTVPILWSNTKSMVLLLEDNIKKVRSWEINEKTANSIM